MTFQWTIINMFLLKKKRNAFLVKVINLKDLKVLIRMFTQEINSLNKIMILINIGWIIWISTMIDMVETLLMPLFYKLNNLQWEWSTLQMKSLPNSEWVKTNITQKNTDTKLMIEMILMDMNGLMFQIKLIGEDTLTTHINTQIDGTHWTISILKIDLSSSKTWEATVSFLTE